eukprot:4549678-Prymnesium_polylepis.1
MYVLPGANGGQRDGGGSKSWRLATGPAFVGHVELTGSSSPGPRRCSGGSGGNRRDGRATPAVGDSLKPALRQLSALVQLSAELNSSSERPVSDG